ncbi:phosphoribosyltransferase [Gymnodinialimonas ceratoperidinii]|uniref:Phosphoribosyltransferase n=1 Tax=Gymnodinialimonas ceratoperidinii TaxID=2856823 RepID=A0A8F6TX82_9RHOB|nr:phosphoribosyltransferase [Gymnodinialimonas ceratoperidinii]QXT40601.1 phosphoribosyltransferase [Gymnodinialimonas ceratoperidinii]
MSLEPHAFWQRLDAPGTYATAPGTTYAGAYPATLPDGRQMLLPIRDLPDGGAVASLIVNQASFAVEDALADAMAEQWRGDAPEVVIGVPTLGLPLANALARRLGHSRMVPLGTSRKFWYTDALSEPISSITSPGKGKTIYLDPRMVPLLEGRRVLLVDDVVSTGTSLAAVLRLLRKADIVPFGIAVAMEQGTRWRAVLPNPERVRGALRSPLLRETEAGHVVAEEGGSA